jgi:hypothetical protein
LSGGAVIQNVVALAARTVDSILSPAAMIAASLFLGSQGYYFLMIIVNKIYLLVLGLRILVDVSFLV